MKHMYTINESSVYIHPAPRKHSQVKIYNHIGEKPIRVELIEPILFGLYKKRTKLHHAKTNKKSKKIS